jgi:exonuclease SbcC
MLTGKDVRITGLRDGLQGIANYKKPTDRGMHPSAERELTAQAMVALDADTHRATAGEQAPAALTALHSSIAHVRGNLQHGKQELDKHARMAARADEMERAAYDLKVAQQETAAAAGEVSAALVALTTARGLVDQALGQYHALLAELAPLATEISTLAGEVALLPRLEQAQSRLEELSAQLQPCTAQLAQADAELAALPELTAVAGTDVQTYRAAVTRCELAEHEHRKAQSMADRAVIEGAAVLARREQLQAQITAGADELSDWTRLGQDLGRDGLQAMELDACLPELNATANDLLHHCHGSRFTVQLHTDRLSADGKRVIEGLDVRVIDTLEGRDALAETYSGGEAVIVGEAVALALTMLACRRSGHDAPTLVRDESGAALDAACGVAYVAMLRRAAGLIGAHRVLFVSHDVSLQALADSRITITDDHQVQVGGAA